MAKHRVLLADIYRTALELGAARGFEAMGAMISAVHSNLQSQASASRDLNFIASVAVSTKLLRSKEEQLLSEYPKTLTLAFHRVESVGTYFVQDLHFDELRAMDDAQIHSSVVVARTQQYVASATDAHVGTLDALMCGALELQVIDPDRNPLRPEIFVSALKEVLEHLQVPWSTQRDWLLTMGWVLGKELRDFYPRVSEYLQISGIKAARHAGRYAHPSYAHAASGAEWPNATAEIDATDDMLVERRKALPATPSLPSPPAGDTSGAPETQLTLHNLRELLAGSTGHGDVEDSTAFRPLVDFPATEPAALMLLEEMKRESQPARGPERRQRASNASEGPVPTGIAALRTSLKKDARSPAQSLSLEVVTLMVDNMVQDPRLLGPIKALVLNMEPALMYLALVDTRVFVDRKHPARVLLQEITHRSLAYATEESPGFGAFLEALRRSMLPLQIDAPGSSSLFGDVLSDLQTQWRAEDDVNAQSWQHAVDALQHAEQRNELAQLIAHKLRGRWDAMEAPRKVVDFLCGHWAQVIAHAQMEPTGGTSAVEKYDTFVEDLLWSVHPRRPRRDVVRLTTLIPPMLSALAEGLGTIGVSPTEATDFTEYLMGLHQHTLSEARSRKSEPEAQADTPESMLPPADATPIETPPIEVWVEPEEALASNFMDIDLPRAQSTSAIAIEDHIGEPGVPWPPKPSDTVVAATERATAQSMDELEVGAWVELRVGGQWTRTQLIWTSAHRSLFMFKSALGASQSMTQRSLERLVAAGGFWMISGHPVMDVALDKVAQTALRNGLR